MVTVGIDENKGLQGLGFDPSIISPAVGDTITFTFQLPGYIKNPQTVQHSATQSTFDDPCVPKPGGFDTGVQYTGSVNKNTGNSYSVVVNNTEPLWFFSSVASDCKSGMVLAVNPPTIGDQTAAAFRANAMAVSGDPGNEKNKIAMRDSPSSPLQIIATPTIERVLGAQPPSTRWTAAPSVTSPPPPSGRRSNSAFSQDRKVGLGLAAIVAIMGVAFNA
ncbi:hypothetical protein NM688_g2964 [Phlebia brevispora]|uniref:Uncharacterized protein n=1 Tax=Phlebia brevispora TaxID=194682 RepID=A0ACC1T795_9APHY|nr:hypothetical protein NM688_g2964 [Phlebia brevispora]